MKDWKSDHCARGRMAIMRSVSSCSVLFVLSMSCLLAAGCDRWTSLANITKETITDNWPEQYLEAITAANKGDCRESWNSLWPLAKHGDRNAIYLLSEMLLEGMEITVNSNYKKDAFFVLFIFIRLERRVFYIYQQIKPEVSSFRIYQEIRKAGSR